MRTCNYEDCGAEAATGKAGFCHGHFTQLQRGRTLTPIYRTTEERFWSRVTKKGGDDCWEWTGSHNGKGYGEIRIQGVKVYAHRYAYEQANGPIPLGLSIDHICRTPACVNPRHLQAVTHAENHQNRTAHRNNSTGFRGVGRRPDGTYLVQAHRGDVRRAKAGITDLEEAKKLAQEFRRELFTNSQEDYK